MATHEKRGREGHREKLAIAWPSPAKRALSRIGRPREEGRSKKPAAVLDGRCVTQPLQLMATVRSANKAPMPMTVACVSFLAPLPHLLFPPPSPPLLLPLSSGPHWAWSVAQTLSFRPCAAEEVSGNDG